MRGFFVIAFVVLASVTARAEVFSFSFGGQTIQIGIQGGCNDMSCVSIHVPGYFSHNATSTDAPRRATRTPAPRQPEAKRAKAKPVATPAPVAAKPAAEPAKSAMVRDGPAAPATRSLAPAPQAVTAPAVEPKSTVEPAPAAATAAQSESERAGTATPPAAAEAVAAPAAQPAPPSAPAAEQDKSMVIAALPEPRPDSEERARPAAPMAIGLWSGSDGQLRIEECGQYLCGYAAGGRHAGKMVLINMRQTKANYWSGRVRDFGSGGVYSATMFLRGANSLRVQGCAFGGMICDGRTLSRVN
jgi:uncharacterized protein (DUF2147 family)